MGLIKNEIEEIGEKIVERRVIGSYLKYPNKLIIRFLSNNQ